MEKEKAKKLNPNFDELCRYTDSCNLVVELEKPFSEFENIFLKVIDKDGEEIKRITLNDISALEKESARLLNELSRIK